MSPDESDDLVYRQQAALVVVVAAVAADATSRIGVCRVADHARCTGYAHPHSHALTERSRTGPGGWRDPRLGIAGDLRIPRRDLCAATRLADHAGSARDGASGLAGDAARKSTRLN